jgi:hypothetical protein
MHKKVMKGKAIEMVLMFITTKIPQKKTDLEDGVLVDAGRLHPLGEGVFRVLAGLHEEHQQAVPELHGRKSRETHEKEDSLQYRDRNELQGTQKEHAQTKEEVGKEHGQACLLNFKEIAMSILLSKGVQVDNAWNSGGNQPRKTQKAIDHVEKSNKDNVIVVGFPMFKLVVLVVDQMPGDSIIKVDKQETHDGRSSSSKWGPARNISKIHKPGLGFQQELQSQGSHQARNHYRRKCSTGRWAQTYQGQPIVQS